MTLAEITERLEAIRGFAVEGDDERAHSAADDLWRDVLTDIASGKRGAAEKARLALAVDGMDFARWCA